MREFFSDVSILSPPSKTLQKQLWTIFVPVMVFCNLSRTRILMDMDCWYLFNQDCFYAQGAMQMVGNRIAYSGVALNSTVELSENG